MGLGDIKDMMGQMRAAQQQMKEVSEETRWHARDGAKRAVGLVKVTVDGEANLIDLEIDTTLFRSRRNQGFTEAD